MRFTLKTLLMTFSVAAVLCCIFFTLPPILAIPLLGLVWLLVPPALIAGIVYGRGYGRAFSIGCMATGGIFPVMWLYACVAFVSALGNVNELIADSTTSVYVKLTFGATCLLMGLSGLTSMTVRWLSLRMAAPQPVAAPTPSLTPANYSVLQRRVSMLSAKRPSGEDDGSERRYKE